jgi:hypothetical protein
LQLHCNCSAIAAGCLATGVATGDLLQTGCIADCRAIENQLQSRLQVKLQSVAIVVALLLWPVFGEVQPYAGIQQRPGWAVTVVQYTAWCLSADVE